MVFSVLCPTNGSLVNCISDHGSQTPKRPGLVVSDPCYRRYLSVAHC